ncbi:thioredoxin domain-containing protein [Streptomyces sp. NPDC002033]|uniref:thioredoxin domain-containing protein n=1 Tax=unclassified Streptomyces TaxID=2593676 RepID=UPI00331D6613
MQAKHIRPVAYTAVWAAIAAAAVAFGPGLIPDREPEREPEPQAYAAITDLPEVLMPDGTTIAVGDPDAETVVRLFEDPRCPVVADFEASGARAISAHTLRHRTRTEYTLASFKDDRLGGDGSKRAVNALRAALDAQRFTEFHSVLMAHQAEVEASGGYTTERLLALAALVPGLRGESFDSAVSTMKYSAFVTASQAAYQEAGDDPVGPGTPAFAINRVLLGSEEFDDFFDEGSTAKVLSVVEKTPEALSRRAR